MGYYSLPEGIYGVDSTDGLYAVTYIPNGEDCEPALLSAKAIKAYDRQFLKDCGISQEWIPGGK